MTSSARPTPSSATSSSGLATALRRHLEHESLWGVDALPLHCEGGASTPRPKAISLLIALPASDLQSTATKTLLAKMIAAIGIPLERCDLQPFTAVPGASDAQRARGVLLFGRAAIEALGDTQQIGGVPAVATHAPSRLLENPPDKVEAWAALQRLDKAMKQAEGSFS